MNILFTDDEEEKNDLDNSRLKPPNPFSQSMNGDKVIISKIILFFWITHIIQKRMTFFVQQLIRHINFNL